MQQCRCNLQIQFPSSLGNYAKCPLSDTMVGNGVLLITPMSYNSIKLAKTYGVIE